MGKENLKYEGEKWRWREVGRIRGRDDSEADSTLAVIRPRHRLYGNCGYSGPALLKSDRGRLVVWVVMDMRMGLFKSNIQLR
jgi:hypothetical protein